MADHPTPSEGNRVSPPPHDRTRTGYRRAFWISLGISAVAHLVLVGLYPSLLFRGPSVVSPFGAVSAPFRPEGTELVNLEEVPAQPDPDVLPPEDVPDPDVETPPLATPPGVGDPVVGELTDAASRGPSAAERLRPKAGDLRLWAPVDPELTRLSDEELMRLLLVAELEDAADSMAVAAEMARRAMDWTYTDDEGRRWGVSPGKLHLGDITLPLPGFSAAPFNREQNANRIWAWDDIDQAAARKGAQDIWKERAEAIRRRKDAERKPDTTGVRR